MSARNTLLMLTPFALGAGVLLAQQIAPAPVNPLAGDESAVLAGRDLYAQVCQSCHGTAGQGSDRGPTLATTSLPHGNADADLFRSIRAGVPGTQMAGFPGLSETDIWRLVAYLRSIQPVSAVSGGAAVNGNSAAGEALFFGDAGCA